MISLHVLYTDPPTIKTLSQQDIVEGRALLVTCQAVSGYPNSTTFYWTKENNPGFRQNGSTLHIPNIQRTSSGTYRCTAENNYSIGEKGTHSQSMDVNVLCEIFFYHFGTPRLLRDREHHNTLFSSNVEAWARARQF